MHFSKLFSPQGYQNGPDMRISAVNPDAPTRICAINLQMHSMRTFLRIPHLETVLPWLLYDEFMLSHRCIVAGLFAFFLAPFSHAQQNATVRHSAAPAEHHAKAAPTAASVLDAGSVSKGVYRNPAFGFTCKIPEGWVLRTDEMNAQSDASKDLSKEDSPKSANNSRNASRVLLAAFSRPPEAHGEDVNSSILIAAENASAYPGIKEAAQYFGPLGEVATAQGLEMIQEPYEFEIGSKTLPRGDFQKDVGTRVMMQSTLAMLARGYALSFTFIGGTEDEVEELLTGLAFSAPAPKR